MELKLLAFACLLSCRSATGSSCVSGSCVHADDETSLLQIDTQVQIHEQNTAVDTNEQNTAADTKIEIHEQNTKQWALWAASTQPVMAMQHTMAEEAYLDLLASSLTGSLQDEAGSCDGFSPGGCSRVKPYNPMEREVGADWPPWGQTMVGFARLRNIRMTLEDVVANKIPGDYAELGVWRGGTGIWSKAIFNLLGEGTTRDVHMFDAWNQIRSYDKLGGGTAPYLAFTEEGTRHNFAKYKVLDNHCKFHKGLFKDSVPKFAKENPNTQLAVLRIDGNFYDSHQDALYNLYEKVPVGGYVIFDDYFGDPMSAGAGWDDFKKDQGCPEEITRIDHLSGYFKKTKDVKVDWSKMKPARDCNMPGWQ